jgi:HSP20 family molecular chaperone IbpA
VANAAAAINAIATASHLRMPGFEDSCCELTLHQERLQVRATNRRATGKPTARNLATEPLDQRFYFP